MNILDLSIYDPREEGVFSDPIIEISVDEEVEEISDPIYCDRYSRVIPCGPFVAVEEMVSSDTWKDHQNIGEFNAKNLYFEMLIPVIILTPEDSNDSENDDSGIPLFMGVRRAKRLIRKYDPEWHLVMNEDAAFRGAISWRPERRRPKCNGLQDNKNCPNNSIQTVYYNNTHLNYCINHLREHNQHVKNLRIRSSK